MNCTVDNLNIHYVEEGSGPALLLLHGWGSSCAAWRGIMAELCGKYRVIAPDLPGFGESDLPPEAWDVERYAAFTLHFMQAVGALNPILIGHSFGGRVIVKLAGTGRVSPEKIVLIDAAGVRPKQSAKTKLRVRTFKLVKGALSLPGIRKYSGNLLASARAHFGSADYNSAPEVLRQTLVRVVNEDLTCHMPQIKAPTLLIYGENDTATPVEDAKKIEALIPDAGLCVIQGAGHFSFIDRPYEVYAILHSFLG